MLALGRDDPARLTRFFQTAFKPRPTIAYTPARTLRLVPGPAALLNVPPPFRVANITEYKRSNTHSGHPDNVYKQSNTVAASNHTPISLEQALTHLQHIL
jgi:hypothetical protein